MLVNKLGIDDQILLIEPTLWSTCTTAGNVQIKDISMNGFTLVQGVEIAIKFVYSNEADNPQIRINAELEKYILLNGTNIPPRMLVAGMTYHFIYNGNAFELTSVASSFATPQKVYVDLTANSNQLTIQGGSSVAEYIGVQGVLGTGNGGTGSSTQTANRLVWSETATSLIAQNHYADATHVAINYTNVSNNDPNFIVNGTARFNLAGYGTVEDFGVIMGAPGGNYLSFGRTGIQAYTNENLVNNLLLQPLGGNIQIGLQNQAVSATQGTFYGVYVFPSTNGFLYSGIAEKVNNTSTPIWLSSASTALGRPVYNNNFTFNTDSHALTFGNGGIIKTTDNGDLRLEASGTMRLRMSNTYPITIESYDVNGYAELMRMTSTGQFLVGATTLPQGNSSKLYVNGDATVIGSLSAGSIVPTANSSLGSSQARWSSVYIGDANSYGDPYTPVYWNSGVPSAVAVIQKCRFTMAEDDTYVEITHAAFDTNTILLSVVITSGEAFIQAPFRSICSSGTFRLTTDIAVTGTVTGYILTARGEDISRIQE